MRRSDPKLEVLARHPLLEGTDRATLTAAGRTFDLVEVPAGRVLMRQGSHGHDVALVLDGTARVEVDGRTVAVVGPGSLVGEIAALSLGRRTATVVAATPMRLAVATSAGLRALLDAHPELATRLLRLVAPRLRTLRAA